MYGNMYHGGPSHNGLSPTGAPSGGSNVMAMMNEREAVALLQHLDRTDLEHLLNNDSKLKDLVDDLSQVKSLQARHDDLVATNKSLAEYNLSLQPKLNDLKQQVAFQYQRVNDLKTSLAEGKTKLDGLVGRQRLDTVLALLQTQTAESEEASEELADKFCEDGEIDVFLGEYLTKRAQAHQRRIKTERFAELIQQGRLPMSSASSNVPSNTYANHSSGMSSSAPYPSTGVFGMPQPNVFPR